MTAAQSISVVVPAYNEARRLARALTAVTTYLASHEFDWEVIVVDDGSTDTTRLIAERFAANDPARIRVVSYGPNRGKGYAVKTGVLAASKQLIVFTDADQATPIEAIADLSVALKAADVAIGSRYVPGSVFTLKQPWTRRLVSRVGNLAIRLLLGLPYHDTQCGFKLMPRGVARSIFDRLTIERWGFDIELLVIARVLGLTVSEVPVTWHDGGESKLRTARVALSTWRELWAIRQNVHAGVYEVVA